MRPYVLIVGSIEVLIWIGLVIWAARQPHPMDLASLHVFFIFCTLPGLALGILNRRLPLAAGLVSTTALVLFVVAAVSQIAS